MGVENDVRLKCPAKVETMEGVERSTIALRDVHHTCIHSYTFHHHASRLLLQTDMTIK